jgi:hypothetical protein
MEGMLTLAKQRYPLIMSWIRNQMSVHPLARSFLYAQAHQGACDDEPQKPLASSVHDSFRLALTLPPSSQ